MDTSMSKNISPAKSNKIPLWNIVYYLVAAMILAVTLFSVLRGKETYTSEAYGVINDTQQKLEDGMEIRIDFTIPRNHFKGISLKFFAETKKQYGNETVYFYLKDNTSGNVVATYELDMKKTLPQVGNFVPLPFEESEEKDVSLYICGRNIKIPPVLCLSEKSNMKSETFVGSRHRRVYSVVFSAVYSDYQAINFQALIQGCVFFLLWILVGIWPFAFRRAQKTAVPLKEKAGPSAFIKVLGRYRTPILFVLMSLLYLFLAVFIYYNNVEETMVDALSVDIVERNADDTEGAVVLDSDDDILTETFSVFEDKLSSVSFEVSSGKADKEAMLHIQLFDTATQILLHDEYVRVSSLPASRAVWKAYLNTEYEFSKGMEIEARITPVGFSSSEVHFYTGDARSAVKAMVGDKRTGNLPVLAVSFADYGFLCTLFRWFAALIYLFLVMAFFMIIVMRWNAQRVYIPVCIFLGILYMLVIPVYSVPDEYAHIDTSYSLSNRLLGIERPAGMDGYDYRREIDVETEEYFTYNVTTDDYRRLYKEFLTVVPKQELTPCVMRATDSNVNILYFAPSAIGIAIGRALQLSTLPVYLMGRLFNLLAFVLLTYLAIRRLDGMKEVFFAYAALPIGLQQAASYSYDSMLDAMGLLFFACCVYFACSKRAQGPVDVFLLLFTSLQMVTVKGSVYFPLCLFLLLIPLERRWKWTRNIPFFVLMGGFICLGFLQGNISSLLTRLLPGSGTRVNAFTGSEVYTFGYLLRHPMSLVRLYGNTILSEGNRLIYEFFGGKMGSVKNVQMPWIYPCIFMVLFAIAVYRNRKDYSLRRISKALCAAVPVMAFLLIGLAMLLANTARDMHYISGLQGRYYIPVMLIPTLCLIKNASVQESQALENTKIITKTASVNDNNVALPAVQDASGLLMWYCLAHVIFILNIVMVVLPIPV